MTRRLRIAVYHNLHAGGAKRTTCAIAQRLSRRHDLDLYALSCSDHSFGDMGDAVRATYTWPFTPLPDFHEPFGRLNFAARLADLHRLDRAQRHVARLIDSRRYDVAYVHPCQFAQTPLLLSHLRTPSMYHSREPLRVAYEPPVLRPYTHRKPVKRYLDSIDPLPAAFRRKQAAIDRAGIRAATHVVTNSDFTRESISRIYGINATVCYHGIDADIFRPLALIRDGGVISVGALTPNKGFDLIIRSLALLPSSIRPDLTIVSNYQEPKEKEYLERMAGALGVRAQFMRLVNDDTLVTLYNRARLVVYAPVLEPFGLVPLEAMACGTPIVAVAEGGVRESVLHERTGLLVDRDPTPFAHAIQRLLTAPELAASYGRQGRDLVLRHWTWDASIARLEIQLAYCAQKNAQRSGRAREGA